MNTENGSRLGSPGQMRPLALSAATALGLYLCYRMALPFVPALTWALALAILFMPVHRRLESALKHPSLAASVSILVIGLSVVVPAALMGHRIISEAVTGADTITARVESGEWQRALDGYPGIAPIFQRIAQQIDLPGSISAIAAWLTNAIASFVRGSVIQAIGVFLTFYLLFYFLRDRRTLLLSLGDLLPLSETDMDRLVSRVGDTVHATIYGTLVVSAVQGTLGGLMFWWLGLPAPALWGLVMGALAVVPVLGAFVVWVPAALFLALDGSWGKALILALWGGVIVSTIDNLIYPILVGNRLKLHTIPAFMSIIGGLIVFGSSGLILGPVTLTVTLLLLEIWRSRTPGVTNSTGDCHS
jgi:predicted PurR-regulated permease PerM